MGILGRILPLSLMLPVAVARGGTVRLDLTAWDGEAALPGGWSQTKLTKSPGYANGVLFRGADYTLVSPRFDGTVQTVTVGLAYGSEGVPERVLRLVPILPNGEKGDELPFDLPRAPKSYEQQTKDMASCGVDQFRIGVNSGKSGYWYVLWVEVSFDETKPVAHADVLNGWKVSEFVRTEGGRFVRDADFSSLARVESLSEWKNGETVDSFYGFSDGVPLDRIRQARSTAFIGGLYAIQTNDVCGLGLLGTGSGGVSLVLPVELDLRAGRKVRGFTVSYRCWQPKVGKNATTLAFHWCAADSPGDFGKVPWIAASEGDYAGGGSGALKTVEIPTRTLSAAGFLFLRWSVPMQTNSSLLGISDLCVTADFEQPGIVLRVQ